MRKRRMIFAAVWLVVALFMPVRAEAVYESSTDTQATVLDYIENNRRRIRENRLTDEQLQLMEDAKEMTANLRRPVDSSKPVPMALEGDDMYYDQTTGDVYARGDVRVTTLDYRRFESEEARGNLKSEEIRVDDKAHMLQLTPGQSRVTLDGYRVVYNYGKQTGRMEDGKGKVGPYYVYGRRFEFYPDKIFVYDGWQTRCGAKTPDYRVSGDLIEIYPGNEILIYQARYWIKDKIIYTRDYYRIDIGPDKKNKPEFPRVGYNNKDGFWIAQNFFISPMQRMYAYADLKYYSKHGYRPVYGLVWDNAGNTAKIEYGYYEDSNDYWIKKKPTFTYTYTHQLGKWPFSYSLNFEEGRWANDTTTSTHTYYGVSLSPYTLKLGGSYDWRMSMSVSYGITKESYDHSKVKGFSYSAMMIRDFGTDLTLYTGYSFSKSTTQNSLFNYGLDSYSHRLDYGASVALTPRDRLVVGESMDVQTGKVQDIDYYWFHDMHCAELIVRRRAKRKEWNVTMEFQPW